MMTYAVLVTDSANEAIEAQADYIALEKLQPLNAKSWLESAWRAVHSLETHPRRCAKAEENDDVDYEVRFILAGRASLLFTVDDERATVWVIALRGDGQLPRPAALPRDHKALEDEETIKALRQALKAAEQSGETGPLDIEEIIRTARRNAGLPPSH